MKAKTFENYMKAKGKELKPWQKDAADALLTVMQNHQHRAT